MTRVDVEKLRAAALLAPQLAIEARVLAELIANPDALALAPDLELDDLTSPWHRLVLETIRNLQATESPREILDIADAIAMEDMKRGTVWGDTVDLTWLTHLVLRAERYGLAFDVVFPADLRHLRAIANARRAVMEAR